jgi:hypothetical protein
MAVTMWGQVAIQSTAPSEDPIQIGSLWVDTSGTAAPKVCTAVSPYTFSTITGGGAPTDADYLVRTANATLSAERAVTDGTAITFDWSVAGVVKAILKQFTGGDVTSAADNGLVLTIGAGTVTEAKQVLADLTTNDVTSTKHGYVPKAPGDATKFLNGAATPAWAVPASTSTKPNLQWTAQGNNPPASAYATPDTRNSHAVLDFDGATDEEAVFAGVLPTVYAGGGLTVETYWAFTTATSGSLRVQADIERIDASSLDTDADSFTGSFQSAGGTAPGTSGQIIKVTITFTSGAQMDSLAAGEAFRLKIRRDADGTSGTDDITTDAELFRVVLRET